MKPTIAVDTRDFSRGVAAVMAAKKQSAKQVIYTQGRLFVQDAIRLTPPFGRAAFTESFRIQRVVGENAVRRDVRKVFKPIEELPVIANPQNEQLGLAIALAAGVTGTRVNAITRNRNSVQLDPKNGKQTVIRTKTSMHKVLRRAGASLSTLQKLLDRAGLTYKVAETVDPSLHKSARNYRGRVRKVAPTYLTKTSSLNRYEREVVGHVGKTKSGWMKAAEALKVAVPAWIGRHAGKVTGLFLDETEKTKASITIGNLVTYSNSFFELRIIQSALARRVQAMHQHANHVIRGNLRKLNHSK